MRAKTATTRRNTVAVVTYDGLSMFEFAIACKVFGPSEADDIGVLWYRLLVGGEQAAVRCENGLVVDVPRRLASLAQAGTVVVPPTVTPEDVPDTTLSAIRRAHARGARIVSLCTGALVLARTGLLDGRPAVTHWLECDELQRDHPAIAVDPDVLYIDDGDVLTSAGSAASLDLCLHVVRLDHGAEIANRLARLLVTQPHRGGGQAQYVETPLQRARGTDLLSQTLAWASEHLSEPLPVDELARRAAMSERQFHRRMLATTGSTPHQWLMQQRTALAQRLLETTDLPIDAVAAQAQFGHASNLRKQFVRRVGVTPSAYRATFAAAG